MKIKQFLKSLEYIKQQTKKKHFNFYVKYDNNDEYVQVYFGERDEDEYPSDEENTSIQPRNKNLVELYSEEAEYLYKKIYDSVEQFKRTCQKLNISDNADIMLTIGSPDSLDAIGVPISDREHVWGEFDISKITFNRNNNKVFLWLEDFDSNKSQPKQYEVTYTVWEQNKYSVDIEAFSEEEAEAKFEEDNTNSTYPDKKDFEVVSVKEI